MMDNTPEYIEMCRKAKDIQASWELKFGDYYWFQDKIEIALWLQSPGNIIRHAMYYQWELPRKMVDCTWLPRQDQLQDMTFNLREDDCFDAECLLIDFKRYVNEKCEPKLTHSFEKMWLAFVVDFYQKKWDGKDWIKI